MHAPFTHKPTIEGSLVLLRPMIGADAEVLAAGMDEESRRLTGTHRSFAIEELRAWAASRATAADRLDLVIVDRATGAGVGEVVINDWEPDDRSCNFRIAIGPAGRDRGFGSQATRLVVDHVFTTTDAHRIGLDVFEFNPRATRVYEKAGFRREGVRRDVLRWDGQFHSSVMMSILRPEWAALTPTASGATRRPGGGGTR